MKPLTFLVCADWTEEQKSEVEDAALLLTDYCKRGPASAFATGRVNSSIREMTVNTHFDLDDGRVGPREHAKRRGVGSQSINRLAICGSAYDAANGSAVHHGRNTPTRHDSVSDRRVEGISRDSYQVLGCEVDDKHLNSWANAFYSAILFH
jgi:hypothetical protein